MLPICHAKKRRRRRRRGFIPPSLRLVSRCSGENQRSTGKRVHTWMTVCVCVFLHISSSPSLLVSRVLGGLHHQLEEISLLAFVRPYPVLQEEEEEEGKNDLYSTFFLLLLLLKNIKLWENRGEKRTHTHTRETITAMTTMVSFSKRPTDSKVHYLYKSRCRQRDWWLKTLRERRETTRRDLRVQCLTHTHTLLCFAIARSYYTTTCYGILHRRLFKCVCVCL